MELASEEKHLSSDLDNDFLSFYLQCNHTPQNNDAVYETYNLPEHIVTPSKNNSMDA